MFEGDPPPWLCTEVDGIGTIARVESMVERTSPVPTIVECSTYGSRHAIRSTTVGCACAGAGEFVQLLPESTLARIRSASMALRVASPAERRVAWSKRLIVTGEPEALTWYRGVESDERVRHLLGSWGALIDGLTAGDGWIVMNVHGRPITRVLLGLIETCEAMAVAGEHTMKNRPQERAVRVIQ